MDREKTTTTSAGTISNAGAGVGAGSGSTRIDIDHVLPSADVIHVGDEQIALGFPEEVVKAWLARKKEITAWLIPDIRSDGGIVHWALEFPLYHALFVRGIFAKGKRIPVLVHERDWRDLVEYLRLTLHGLTREELLAERVEPAVADQILAETRLLALKDREGRVVGIEELLEPHFMDAEGVVEYAGLRIKSHGDNTYSFFTEDDRVEEHRLDTSAPQVPPYTRPLSSATSAVRPQPFEVIALGASHGFDPAGPCSNLVVQANGRFLVVDCGPYIRRTLESSGIGLNQVGALVLTHAHEDHAVGLSALLDLTHRLKLFATAETASILRRKIAILNPGVASPATLLDDSFDVCPVRVGRTYDLLGLELRFHYTMHSIPCTGVELSMRHGETARRVLVVGDNNSRANIEAAGRSGAIPPARLAELLSLYVWRGDLVVADAGSGMIHGTPADFRDNESTSVVYFHTAGILEAERHLYTLAEPGHRYTLAEESSRPTPLERGIAYKALLEATATGDTDWLNALLDSAVSLTVNRGHLVVRKDDRTHDLYVVLTGELEVLAEKGGRPARVAEIHAGEIFGEMAVINGAPRSASVMALTPARLIRVPGDLFRRFAEEERLVASLPELWRNRADLERARELEGSSVTTRNALARRAVRRALEPGATIIREGSSSTTVYVLVKGRAQVYRGQQPLLVNGTPVILEPGSLLGETAPFLKKARNASVVTLDECEVLALRGADFKEIVRRSPQLLHRISRVVRQRLAA
jgi:CRP-like cAMP-binding protein